MRKLITALSIVAAVMLGTSGIAAAQAPTGTLTATPASIDAAGSTDFTVELGGFTAGLAVFLLPCPAPDSGDMADFDAATCDQANLTPVSIGDDGTASVDVTYDVAANGIVLVAGDAARTEFGITMVPVGAAELAVTGPADTGTLFGAGIAMITLGVVAVRRSRED